jgi:hypothetical protein
VTRQALKPEKALPAKGGEHRIGLSTARSNGSDSTPLSRPYAENVCWMCIGATGVGNALLGKFTGQEVVLWGNMRPASLMAFSRICACLRARIVSLTW